MILIRRGRQAHHRFGVHASFAGRAADGHVRAAAPGEVAQIDSAPMDVLVLLDDGGRVELTK